MGRLSPTFLILLVVLGTRGCEQEAEPTYKGKPLSEWIVLSKDRDFATRKQAFQALAYIPDRRTTPLLLKAAEASYLDAVLMAPDVYEVTIDDAPMTGILVKHLRAEIAKGSDSLVGNVADIIRDKPATVRTGFVAVAKEGLARGGEAWDELLRAAEGRPTASEERHKAWAEYRVVIPKYDAPTCPACLKKTGVRIARRHASIDGKASYRCDRCGLIETAPSATTRPK